MKRKKKRIPKFKSLEEEMEFWGSHSVTDFELKEVTVEEILEEMKRCPKAPVTLQLETELLNQLKAEAARREMPYKTLIRELLLQALRTGSH